jgi:hypothetical protein
MIVQQTVLMVYRVFPTNRITTHTNLSGVSGRSRTLLPVALKTALAMAAVYEGSYHAHVLFLQTEKVGCNGAGD